MDSDKAEEVAPTQTPGADAPEGDAAKARPSLTDSISSAISGDAVGAAADVVTDVIDGLLSRSKKKK